MRIEQLYHGINKPKTGSKTLNKFLNQMAKGVEKRINNCSGHSFIGREDPEMPFWYNEQTTKGIITATIDEITKTNFFQEYSIKRTGGNGRVDYWLEYGDRNKIQILLEVKQNWARIYPEEATIYSNATKLFNDAIKQLSTVENKLLYANFAISLLVMPLFARYKTDAEKLIILNEKKIEKLRTIICKRFNLAYLYKVDLVKTNKKYNNIIHSKTNSKSVYESYPGVCLIYYVRKITKN